MPDVLSLHLSPPPPSAVARVCTSGHERDIVTTSLLVGETLGTMRKKRADRRLERFQVRVPGSEDVREKGSYLHDR